jgi:hypothetical protein
MDVSFTLWSLNEVLAKIPFDDPPISDLVALDFSEIAAPYYVKHGFKVSIIYEDSLPYEACCSIYLPEGKNIVTVVIIIKREYETAFKAWRSGDKSVIQPCCFRRGLYCHESCHLVAIMRAFPSDRSSRARDDFITKIKEKFAKSVKTAEEIKAVPLASAEKLGESPSVFDKDHFRYGDDNLNYFELYKELMFPYDRMLDAIGPLSETYKKTNDITFDDVAEMTLVSKDFFDIFPEKLTAFQELLAEKLFTHDA